MARLKLTVISPPQTFTEPIFASDVLEYLEIPAADTTRASLIARLITAARTVAELRQGRDLVSKQWDLTTESFPSFIQLREGASSVDLIRYRDSTGAYVSLVDGTGYIFDAMDGVITPIYGGSWPSFTAWPNSPILIRYTVTAAAVEADVIQGMNFLITQWYFNRVPAEIAGSKVAEYPFALALLDHGKVESV